MTTNQHLYGQNFHAWTEQQARLRRSGRSHGSGTWGEACSQQWQGSGFLACNACDPEGNLFQVRESAA
jgi:hypothetical protein